MMADTTPPTRRRWFQFRLGTMLIVVTVLASWLAYHVHWLRAREDFLAQERALHLEHAAKYGWELSTEPTYQFQPPASAPAVLRLMGAEGYSLVSVLTQAPAARTISEIDRARVQRAKLLFPEGQVSALYFFDAGLLAHEETRGDPE